MKKIKVYEYAKCSTCVKALKFLKQKKVDFEACPIVENPPSLSELKMMLEILKKQEKGISKLFNTSGVLYKEMNLSTKLKSMSESEALQLLSEHGKLVKRPFVLIDKTTGFVGFNEADWGNVF